MTHIGGSCRGTGRGWGRTRSLIPLPTYGSRRSAWPLRRLRAPRSAPPPHPPWIVGLGPPPLGLSPPHPKPKRAAPRLMPMAPTAPSSSLSGPLRLLASATFPLASRTPAPGMSATSHRCLMYGGAPENVRRCACALQVASARPCPLFPLSGKVGRGLRKEISAATELLARCGKSH